MEVGALWTLDSPLVRLEIVLVVQVVLLEMPA
jgi:hypothetical protein